jgi:hypothetical protein
MTAALHADLHAFLREEVTGWGIISRQVYTQIYRGIQSDDIIFPSERPEPLGESPTFTSLASLEKAISWRTCQTCHPVLNFYNLLILAFQ